MIAILRRSWSSKVIASDEKIVSADAKLDFTIAGAEDGVELVPNGLGVRYSNYYLF
jgi:hypothetical protein